MKNAVDIPKVLRFWRTLEASIPQKAEKANKTDLLKPIYAIGRTSDQAGRSIDEVTAESAPLMPWEDPYHARKPISKDKAWRYVLQCGLYETKALAKQVEAKLGSHEDVFDERISFEKSRLFDLGFDESGYPLAGSFVLSLASWSAGQLLHFENGIQVLEAGGKVDLDGLPSPQPDISSPQSGYHGFDSLVRAVTQWIKDEAARLQQADTPATFAWANGLTKAVMRRCLLPDGVIQSVHLGKCYQVRRKENQQEADANAQGDDLLNSFFVEDLNTLTEEWSSGVGTAFAAYMTASAGESSGRVDVRSQEGVNLAFQRLLPSLVPSGKWPSEFPLAFSQQLAVNELWKDLGAASHGIFAVNGPPGTGKTTMLRDVVAAVVTERAQRLADLGSKAFGAGSRIEFGGASVPYKNLHAALSGTAIVVASANNGAVENISLELPGIEAIPESMRDSAGYFPELASRVLGKPAWGLLAARLGNKENRTSFIERFWWSKPEAEQDDDSQGTKSEPAFADRKEGLRYHLSLIKEKRRQPELTWNQAVTKFKKAAAVEAACREALAQAAQLPGEAAALAEEIGKHSADMQRMQEQIGDRVRVRDARDQEIEALSGQALGAQEAEQAAQKILQAHITAKPGFLTWLSTLGASHRHWWAKRQELEKEHERQQRALRRVRQVLGEMQLERTDVSNEIVRLESDKQHRQSTLRQRQEDLVLLQEKLADARTFVGDFWPDPHATDDVRELSTPWAIPAWHQAREALFLAALAVHRAFVESHPAQIIENLGLASHWLKGKEMPQALTQLAMDSLCLVVPVISTTFASTPRMLRNVGREAIGWLLIDEAGQALPQQAAGAIWRAKRAVVVGDPNQLEPVLTVPIGLEGALARHYDVPQTWWPSKTSAQRLADQTIRIGTWLPDGVAGHIWVGCPLRVHRRCDEPMFSISNLIAYDGLMVHGKRASASDYPDSHWIDVRSDESEGHWIPEEGRAAEQLIKLLRTRYQLGRDDLFLISPFRDCANRLAGMAQKLGLDSKKTGTIHTTQGKEAEVVILLLGGDPKRTGAKGWAAEKPNLLNVAVSRAKSRLYVIGDRVAWGMQANFAVLAEKVAAGRCDALYPNAS